MTIRLTNAQRTVPVNLPELNRLARRAARSLRIRQRGAMEITFIDERRMRRLNQQFLSHDRPTDVLSFRYDLPAAPQRVSRGTAQAGAGAVPERVVGEILIAPQQARRYARAHGLSYREELSRYVVHGLLHWLGHEDRTAAERRRMRLREDKLLGSCMTGRGNGKTAAPAPR